MVCLTRWTSAGTRPCSRDPSFPLDADRCSRSFPSSARRSVIMCSVDAGGVGISIRIGVDRREAVTVTYRRMQTTTASGRAHALVLLAATAGNCEIRYPSMVNSRTAFGHALHRPTVEELNPASFGQAAEYLRLFGLQNLGFGWQKREDVASASLDCDIREWPYYNVAGGVTSSRQDPQLRCFEINGHGIPD